MGTTSFEIRAIRWPLLLLPALALLAACGDREPQVMMPIETVVASLVDDKSAREVLLENEAAPVVAGTYAPSAAFRHDSSPLPALRLTPPARVRLQLGRLPEGALLRFGVGFDQSAYEGADRGRVRFRLGDGTKVLLEETMPFGKDIKVKARHWRLGEIDIAGVESILLETEVIGGAGTPPAAFASLQVITTAERPRERAAPEKPNVVLIVLDTQRFDRLSCYGGREGLTPTLDALAERGVLFESAYASSSWTWPSTASILTSLTVAEHGLESHRSCYLSQSLLTLAEAFQAAGWTTGAISSNPLVHADKEFDQGFETFQHLEWGRAGRVTEDALLWLREHAEWLNMNTVRSHSDYGIRQAVKHLQKLGHERIGYVGARDSHRYPSLVAQLAAQQLPIDVTWHCWIKWTLETNWPQQWRSVAHQAFLEHLDRQPEATAYLCTNDMVGLGVVDALQACGLEPGRDVSLVGYDNYEQRVLGEAKPILTTIDNPGDVVGAHAAVRLLNQILHGQTEIAQVRIPTQLIVRETTGPCL